MNATQQAAFDRVTAAVADKPVGKLSYSEVIATDVATLGCMVPLSEHEPATADITAGAKNAHWMGPKATVFQTTEHLRRLLELVQATASK